jgi:hypothetical protein
MAVNEVEHEEEEEPTPTISTLEQKIDELAKSVDELRKLQDTYTSKRKAVNNLVREIRQLASDLNVEEKQLRMMVSRSFAMTGISKSWQRKLLPESLKFTKHTRKDYLLKQEQQREQQSLLQVQQQLPPSDDKATKVATCDIKVAIIPKQTQKEEEHRDMGEELEKNKTIIIEKLQRRIQNLQTENRYLRETTAIQGQQQQQQEEDTFTALGRLEHLTNCVPVRVTVNLKTKTIKFMEIAYDLIQRLEYPY